MQTSLKMTLGLVSLAIITLVYWGTIEGKTSWASDAMTSPTTMASKTARKLPKRVFCFGDSLTAGTSPPTHDLYPYARYLENALTSREGKPEITVGWKGFPGWTSSLLLTDAGFSDILNNAKRKRTSEESSQTQIDQGLPPFDLVIILAGTNDLAYSIEADPIFEDIKSIHNLALDKGCAHTLALGIPPSGWQERSEQARDMAASVNEQLESWATTTNEQPTTTYLPFPIQTYDRTSDLWSPDGLHFSEKGYELLGNSLAPIVDEILSME